MDHCIQDSSTLSINENAISVVSCSNFGVATPQKVNSLAELMDLSLTRSEAPNISTGLICPQSQIQGNQGHVLQQITSKYNLNLPPGPEAGVVCGVELQKQSQISQHLDLVHKSSTQEKCIENNITISNCDGENGGIDLNQTPQPRPPKRNRKKHRPKVVIEGKPKQTPKPPPPTHSTGKRKYVCKTGIQTSESKGRPPSKRKLDFELENESEKKVKDVGGLNCHQADDNLNLDAHINTHGRKKHQHHGETRKNFLNEVAVRDHTLNVIARSFKMQNANTNQSIDANRYRYRNSHCIIQAPDAYYNSRQSTLSTMPQLVQELMGVTQTQAADKLYTHSYPHTIKDYSNNLWSNGLYTSGGRNVDKASSGLLSSVVTTQEQDFSGQIGSSPLAFAFAPTYDITPQNIYTNQDNISNNLTPNCFTNYPHFRHRQKLNFCRPQSTYQENNNTNFINQNVGSASQTKPKVIPLNDKINSTGRLEVSRQTAAAAGQTSSNKRSQSQEQSKNKRNYRNSVTAIQEERLFSVDYITRLLKDLNISNNTLVPYKGDGAIIQYEEIDVLKKRRARARVDLDPETNRLWNLLMGKEEGKSAEKMDTGDRRFSKWKGSVVDSVIGVFLTQNVSDHLSSSAFMSLAAKFPLKSTTVCCKSPLIEHHEVRITHPPHETCYEDKILREPEKKAMTHLVDHHTKDFAQTYSEPIGFQSYETEDGLNLTKKCNYRNAPQQLHQYLGSLNADEPLFCHQQLQNATHKQNEGLADYPYPLLPSAKYCPNLSLDLEKWEEDVLAFLGTESISSSLASTYFEITTGTVGVNHPHYDYIGQSSESSFTSRQDDAHKFQQSPVNINNATPNKHPPLKSVFSDDQHVEIHKEIAFLSDSMRPAAESLSTWTSGIDICQKHTDDTTPEPAKTGDPLNSSHKQATNLSSARKRKVETEKVEPFDWDSLRKQVQSKEGRRREREDSLDYEALRKADVREISDAIKERGMNNMLAERMKSFLNRLVRDHEKIDLEWLRNVEPDKAKNLALSVNTTPPPVAVRWTQMLDALLFDLVGFLYSHFLSHSNCIFLNCKHIYPVLESIQKYLWPRLCKLDLETLYELHYQMITFGKVFCTKREPNCNACPMKGECRHFASAFASARLALPGPEEKSIVSSAAPVTPNRRPNMIISIESGRELNGSCQPLIEEPTTPEPPITEVLERDIEDACYEDPDEIPVIKLDVQEFTSNLHNVMQKQLEMGEADMSRALVALSPEIASLPIPKLKHVTRLRTEHQVYQLPDSHPLLKGMDRRETDDPSPYLLAIWTPGETADCIQPPESRCISEEGGGVCNNGTCFSCNSTREAHAETVRGTILIPCRTAMRGSFPLNGTYFQVNEVFADHESSVNPIHVSRNSIWNLPRRTVFFGTSVSSIFKGLSTEYIQYCFWKVLEAKEEVVVAEADVCVNGDDKEVEAREGEANLGSGAGLAAFAGGDELDAGGLVGELQFTIVLEEGSDWDVGGDGYGFGLCWRARMGRRLGFSSTS
ncbi:hypothetical protein STAS_15876 [Striga asiatica]|uniref:Uncharacterized protein n=1 Tax=Striga asiatica TaxID=4170 RepID=A0A5A7Q308_STRAF|nr:hypothetical protein STAS_15876 [Striga asiatica]